MGLVNEAFTPEQLEKLKGDIGVGHVRYSTEGGSTRENAQPLVLNYVKGTLGLAHNGNLINAPELREVYKRQGSQIVHIAVKIKKDSRRGGGRTCDGREVINL